MQGQMDHGLANARFNEQQENIAPILDALRQYGSGVAERVSAFADDPAQALYGGFADTMGINLDRPMDEYAEMARNPQAGEIDPNSPAVLEAMGWLPGPADDIGGLLGRVGSEVSQLGDIGAKRAKAPITELEEGVQTGQRISTANPTKIAAEGFDFHQVPDYEVDLEMMRTNPEAYTKNMQLMSAYTPSRKRNPEARAQDYIDILRGNLEYLIKEAPDDFVGRSGNWYKGANALANDISNAYGVPIEASGAVLARLSPGMDWLQNVEQADRLVDIWRNQQKTPAPGGKFKGVMLEELTDSKDKAQWIREYDETVTDDPSYYGLTPEGALTDIQMTKAGDKPKSLMWQSKDNLSRAVEMLEDPSIENISRNMGLSGHKIRNFYNNIVDPFNPRDVTIDTHAVSAAQMRPYSQKGIPVGHAFGGGAIPGVVGGSSKSGMASGTYGLYADAYRQAAENMGLLPQSLQSPTWELIRETFPTSGAQKDMLRAKMDPIVASLRRGDMTREGSRDALMDIATKGQGLVLPDWYTQ